MVASGFAGHVQIRKLNQGKPVPLIGFIGQLLRQRAVDQRQLQHRRGNVIIAVENSIST